MKKTFPDCPFSPIYPSELNRDDTYFMSIAYNEALKAWNLGEVPVGAVIALDGMVIAKAFNMVEQNQDATAHAEIIAIGQASSFLEDWRLNECTLYVTKEPCPMCSGASIMSRFARVVYAVPDPKMGFLGGAININEVNSLNHKLQITQGTLQEECTLLLRTFFLLKREENK
ncbi:MAG: nucleoside deaminase [Opitutales bacterium]